MNCLCNFKKETGGCYNVLAPGNKKISCILSALLSVVNIILALPYLLFVVFIAGVLGRSLFNVIMIFGITDAPIFVRVVRGEVLRIKRSVYVEAAQSTGVSQGRILFQHILPNLIGPFLTVATFEMSAMILYEAGLGFLGLSVPSDVPCAWASRGNFFTSAGDSFSSRPPSNIATQ